MIISEFRLLLVPYLRLRSKRFHGPLLSTLIGIMLEHRPSHVIPGGRTALVLFVVSLVSFTAQSQLAQYLQTTLGYRKPYFTLYCAHSSFLLLFPLHLGFLYLWSGETVSIRLILRELVRQVKHQLVGPSVSTELATKRSDWPWAKTLVCSVGLTAGMTVPAGCWYASVPLTSMTSITTIYNTSALFAYVFSVFILAVPLELKKVTAVGVATVGVALVAYGGVASPGGQEGDDKIEDGELGDSFLGDLLALGGAASYGLYEVLYKRYFSLSDPPRSLSSQAPTVTLPFALHANLLTSAIGLTTLTVLAIPLFVFDALGWEAFELPSDWTASLTLVGIVLGGIGFNGSFMILLGLWGPVVASVGNLLTIILVALSESMFSDGSHPLTLTILTGGLLVCASFGVLVWDLSEGTEESAREIERIQGGGPQERESLIESGDED